MVFPLLFLNKLVLLIQMRANLVFAHRPKELSNVIFYVLVLLVTREIHEL